MSVRTAHTEELDDMATALVIEEESGSSLAAWAHPHRGYFAGDFSRPRYAEPTAVRSETGEAA